MLTGKRRTLPRAAYLTVTALLALTAVAAHASSIPLTLYHPNPGDAADNAAVAQQSAAVNDGLAALTRRDYDAAITDFTNAIRTGYRPAAGYVERATAYQDDGNIDQAIADCSVALQLDPKFATAWVTRGTFEYVKRDYLHAVADDTEALRLNPGNDMAWYQRGVNETAAGEYEQAIADFDHLLNPPGAAVNPPGANGDTSSDYGLVVIDTEGMRTNFYRGLAYLKNGQLDQAEADFTAALQADPKNVNALIRRGETRLRQGQHDPGLADFAQAEKLAPQNADLYNECGVALLDVHEYKLALDDFSTALRLNPNSTGALNNLGLAYLNTGDPDRAIDAFTRALNIDPTLALAYCNRANALTARGKLDAALADLDQAAALDPQSPSILSDLGLAYSKMGDYAKAIANLDQAVALDPGMGGAYNNLAWLLATCPDATIRDGPRALTAATMACKLSEWKDPISLDTFAAACAEAGDFAAAVKWEQAAIAAKGFSPADLADAQKRLALYQAHKTYTEDPRTVPTPPAPSTGAH